MDSVRLKTITVQGFNSTVFDDKVNKFINEHNVQSISFHTDFISLKTYEGRKFVYTANILYKEG